MIRASGCGPSGRWSASSAANLALGWIEEITAAINLLGGAGATRVVGAMMKAVDFVTSNVPGPPFPVFMSGARIERMFPFGPPAGATVNITLFSYDGVAQIGVRSDPVAVPDPGQLVADLQAGFDEVLAVGSGAGCGEAAKIRGTRVATVCSRPLLIVGV